MESVKLWIGILTSVDDPEEKDQPVDLECDEMCDHDWSDALRSVVREST